MSGQLSPTLEWTLFLALASAAMLGAYRMLRTMSMVRAGLSLMASFCAVAGLFLVLSADLLAAMQIMMYVGGMLVMIVFMVMMSPDPGGSMMGIAPPEEGKGMEHGGMKHAQMQHQEMQNGRMQKHHRGKAKQYTCPMHPEVRFDSPGKCPKCGMQLQPMSEEGEDGGMQMDMAMTHEFTKPAAALGITVGAALVWAILTVDWPAAATVPADFDSGRILGKELLSRYMIGFEAAAILIILGVVGAVIFGRRE